MRSTTIITLLPVLVAASACDPNVDAGYAGEPLVSLRGEVLKPAQAPTQDLEVAVLWNRFSTDGDFHAAEKVAIEGSFPAAFDLDIYAPPGEDFLNHLEGDDPGFGLAYIFALDAGAELSTVGENPEMVQGLVEDHLLVYAAGDIAAESEAAAYLGGTAVKAGFHLFTVIRATEADFAEYDACVAMGEECAWPFDRLVPTPLDTPLALKLGALDDLNPPNVF